MPVGERKRARCGTFQRTTEYQPARCLYMAYIGQTVFISAHQRDLNPLRSNLLNPGHLPKPPCSSAGSTAPGP